MSLTTLPITSLIPRDRPEQPTLPVPKEVTSELHRWAALSTQFGGRLSRLVHRPVEAEVSFRVTSHAELRRELPQPGILLPVGREEDHAFLRFDAQTAMQLTGLLLGDEEGLSLPPYPSVLDGIAMLALAEPLAEVIEEGFGLALPPDRTRPIAEDWSLTPPPKGSRLLATFELRMGADQASFDLLFPPLSDEVLEAWGSGAGERPGHGQLLLEADFNLCRWRADGRTLAGIKPGVSVSLPGADLQKVTLEVVGAGVRKPVAAGAVTNRFGRRNMKIERVGKTG